MDWYRNVGSFRVEKTRLRTIVVYIALHSKCSHVWDCIVVRYVASRIQVTTSGHQAFGR